MSLLNGGKNNAKKGTKGAKPAAAPYKNRRNTRKLIKIKPAKQQALLMNR
jgi:ATP-dependent DNA ligase